MKGLERVIERIVLASRWLLVVFYLGLAIALAIYGATFLIKLWKLSQDALALSEADMILRMLGLIDAALVASLVVMVMLSGYENFVSRFEDTGGEISWLGKMSAGTLKVKVASSIVAISSIHLLQVFLNIGSYTSTQIWQLTAMHLAFVASAVFLAILDRMIAATKSDAGQSAPAGGAERPQ